MKAERIGLKRIGLQKIGLPRIGVMGAGASMRPTEIVGISYAREIGSIPSAMGNGLLTSEKWAKVSVLRGNSVVDGEQILSYQQWGEKVIWNQLMKNHDFSKDENLLSYANGIYTLENGVCTVTTLDSQNLNGLIMKHYKRRDGHVLCIAVTHSGDDFNVLLGNALNVKVPKSDNITTYHRIFKAPIISYSNNINLFCNKIASTFKLYKVTLYDFTEMFGEGNEPTTIEEFERRRPRNVSNEYNEGTEISGDIEIKSVGFNQWDEEWEVGTIESTNGGNSTSKVSLRSKNLIPVIGGKKYKYVAPYSSVTQRYAMIFFYGNNKKYIKNVANIRNGSIITMPTEAYYCRIMHKYYIQDYGTYNNDISLHLVQDGLVSQYKPYTSTTTPLPNVTLIKDADGNQLFPYGLCSAGSVYDEITETKAIKRVGVVDLGSLIWGVSREGEVYVTLSLAKLISREGSGHNLNLLSAIYSPNIEGHGKIVFVKQDGALYVRNHNYTSTDDFKQAMQGVLLYYELATPIEVEIDKWKAEYKVEQGGTEQIVSANDTTNLKTDIIYGNKV